MHLGSKTETARTLTSTRVGVGFALAVASLIPGGAAHARGGGEKLDRAERTLLRQVNSTRKSHGLPALRRSRRLQRSADYHCWDMLHANFFAHASSNGTPMEQRVRRYTRSNRIGENLAYVRNRSPRTAARQVLTLWLNSPPHRELLLSRTFRRVGIARRVGSFGAGRVAVYTADFASAR